MAPEHKAEAVFWAFGVLLFLVVTIIPAQFFRFLGRGRVHPPNNVLLIFRIGAGACALALIYRIATLVRQ